MEGVRAIDEGFCEDAVLPQPVDAHGQLSLTVVDHTMWHGCGTGTSSSRSNLSRRLTLRQRSSDLLR